MREIAAERLSELRSWFLPERPGPLIGFHVLNTGVGAAWVDRWPRPRTLLVDVAGNQALRGDPTGVPADVLRSVVHGFVEADERFDPLLRAAFPDLQVWDRVVLVLPGRPTKPASRRPEVRRLGPADDDLLAGLPIDLAWIGNTWGGPVGLAAGGRAWGGFLDGRLVSVAAPFFVGDRYEDLGVVTAAEARGRGLSTACAAAVCSDVVDRGRRPSWTTSPDNSASLRVAEKLGFTVERTDRLLAAGVQIPASGAPG